LQPGTRMHVCVSTCIWNVLSRFTAAARYKASAGLSPATRVAPDDVRLMNQACPRRPFATGTGRQAALGDWSQP